jgi:acyl-CoA synthetase (AMP-forming)/AMP-acid ligase II
MEALDRFLSSDEGVAIDIDTRTRMLLAATELLAAKSAKRAKAAQMRGDRDASLEAARHMFGNVTGYINDRLHQANEAEAASETFEHHIAKRVTTAFTAMRDAVLETDPNRRQAWDDEARKHITAARKAYRKVVDEMEATGIAVPAGVIFFAAEVSDDEINDPEYVDVSGCTDADVTARCAACTVLIQHGLIYGRRTERYHCLECRFRADLCVTCHDTATSLLAALEMYAARCNSATAASIIEAALDDACPHVVSHTKAIKEQRLGARTDRCWLVRESTVTHVLRRRVNAPRTDDTFAKRVVRAFAHYAHRPFLGLVEAHATDVRWLTYAEVEPVVRAWSAAVATACRAVEHGRKTDEASAVSALEPMMPVAIGVYTRSNAATYMCALTASFVAQGRPIGFDGRWAHNDAVAGLAAPFPEVVVLDREAAAAFCATTAISASHPELSEGVKHVIVVNAVALDTCALDAGAVGAALRARFPHLETCAVLADTVYRQAGDVSDKGECPPWPPIDRVDTPETFILGVLTSGSSGGQQRKGVWRTLQKVEADLGLQGRFPEPLATFLYYSPTWSTGWSIAFTVFFEGGRLGVPACSQSPPTPWDGMRLVRPTAFISCVPHLVQDLLSRIDHREEELIATYRIEEESCVRPAAFALGANETPGGRRLHQLKQLKEGRIRGRAKAAAAQWAYHHLIGGRARVVGTGGAIVPIASLERLTDTLPMLVLHGYGATEGGSIGSTAQTVGMLKPATGTSTKLEDRPELGYTTADLPYPRGELLIKNADLARKTDWLGCTQAFLDSRYDSDGYYRTGDIVEWHPETDEFRVIDRASASVKLPNGTFFAPSRVELAIADGFKADDEALASIPVAAVGPFATVFEGRVVVAYCVVQTEAPPGQSLVADGVQDALLRKARHSCRLAGLVTAEIPEALVVVAVSPAAVTPSMKLIRAEAMLQLGPTLRTAIRRVVRRL